VSTTTPGGVDVFGNPTANVPVSVLNNLGGFNQPDAYVYLPALIQASDHALAGRELKLRVISTPGSFFLLAVGTSIPGFGLPIPPFDGALVIVSNLVPLTGLQFSPTGQDTLFFPLPKQLGGKTFEFQAISITDLVGPGGSFTNTVSVAVLP
jgi:hypothetical protein